MSNRSSAKVRKRSFEESTPTMRRHHKRENKDHSGIKSAPHDLGKARKRKKPQYDEKMILTPRKSNHRGGWITKDPRDDFSYEKSKRNHWRSLATPSESWDNKIYMIIEYGNGWALSPPPPPKPVSPTQQIVTSSCDSENNQCTQLVFIKSDHKRKNSPPPPHEVTRPAPPPPKLPSSSPRPGIKMLQEL
ncbi:hypothetical protein LWI29_030781 [Acer saccharum]|uniref:Uncharacterized protein n=1 Tax=Acer saccharum TaxID=4024 RepID=A0AA39VYL5_ACESA|nr:hypothetical protein LWI29_030781 [Acer saccharum]